MYKKSCMFLLIIGILLMCAVVLVFGFVETSLPSVIYLLLWFLCAGLIDYASRGMSLER